MNAQRKMSLTFPMHQDIVMGEAYWTYDDDGSPVPPGETPEDKALERAHAWHVRENDYPLSESGYAYCASCGEDVTERNFVRYPNAETKDHCETCAHIGSLGYIGH